MLHLVGVSPLAHAHRDRETGEDHSRWNVGCRKCFEVICSASKGPGGRRRKDNYWAMDFKTVRPRRTVVKTVKQPKKKKTPQSPHVSGFPPVEYVETLQEEEIVSSPLWNTFASNLHGVWTGVGAAFSPQKATMEPLSLEDGADCRIVSFAESDAAGKIINRETLWNIKTLTPLEISTIITDRYLKPRARKKQQDDEHREQVSDTQDENEFAAGSKADVAFEDDEELTDVEDDEEFTEAVSQDFLEDDDSDFTEADIQDGIEDDEEAGSDGDLVDAEDFTEDDSQDDFEGDEEFVESGSQDDDDIDYTDAGSQDEDEEAVEELPVIASKRSCQGMESVLEKVSMAKEPGLVYFEDGTYSSGPLKLVQSRDEKTSYYNQPTYKIEQCLVDGGHRRVRIVHTIAVNNETEEVEVLRVAAYEEEWLSPVNAEGIRDLQRTELDMFSQRRRTQPQDLVGVWKVFEMSAEEQESPEDESEAWVYACREFKRRRKPPAGISEDRGTVLWLPGGIYTYVELTKFGFLRVGAGWNVQEGINLVIERDFNSAGKLCRVRRQAEVRQPKAPS